MDFTNKERIMTGSKIFKWIRILEYILLLAICFCLPLSKQLLPYLIGATLFFWLIDPDLGKKLIGLKNNITFYLMIGFFLVNVVGLIYTKNITEGLFLIQVKLSIFFLPIIIFSTSSLDKQRISIIYRVFVLGNLIACLACIIIAFKNSLYFEGGKVIFNPYLYSDSPDLSTFRMILKGYTHFNYSNFSIIHHPAYFSMYLLFSIAIIFSSWKELSTFLNKLLGATIIVFFFIIVFLLSARAGIIALISVFVFYFGIYLKTKYILWHRLFLVGIIIAFIAYFAVNNNRFQSLFNPETHNEDLYTKIKSDMRWQMWSSGIKIVGEHPVFGVGTGDVRGELVKEYRKRDMEEAFRRNMNVHNQFLETYLGLGIIGFLMLISMFVVPFIDHFQDSSKLLCILFIIIIIVNFFFETMLNTIAGVVFFAYFYPLVFYRFSDNKPEKYNWKVIFRD